MLKKWIKWLNKFYSPLMFCNLFFIIVLSFLIILNLDIKRDISFFEEKNKGLEIANTIIENKNYNVIYNHVISNKFINLILEKEGILSNKFLDYKSGKELEINNLIKKNKIDEFNAKINQLLELKYPKFINDVLKTDAGRKIYEFNDSFLLIRYLDYVITPEIEEELTLIIYYNEIQNYLDFKVQVVEEYENENGYIYDEKKKTVAITFDDGPAGEKTKSILTLLEENKAHATFFMVGYRMREDVDTVKAVYNSKNEIGSHSLNHKNLTRLTPEEILKQEKETEEIYYHITGDVLKILRPPYGAYNQKVKDTLDYSLINWSIDPEDWRYKDVDLIINHILENISDGDIILFHDLYETTVESVKILLPILYAQGYQVVSVSELASLKGYNLESHQKYNHFR